MKIEGMIKVTISEAAKQLVIPEESVRILIKHHRIATDYKDGQLIARDDDVNYFVRYFERYGKLPDL